MEVNTHDEEITDMLDGIEHPRIRELIKNHPNTKGLLEEPVKLKPQNIRVLNDHLSHIQERKWLIQKGKHYLIDFDEQ